MSIEVIYRLMFIGIALAVIGVGTAIFYSGTYPLILEHRKTYTARGMSLFGIVLWIFGFGYLVYCLLSLQG